MFIVTLTRKGGSMRLFSLISLFIFFCSTSAGRTLDDILHHLDDLYRSRSSRGVVRMVITTPHWERELEMRVWTRGEELTLIKITAPAREKGMGTLKAGREMWNYLPAVNKVIKIPPSMMMGSWMGSDFKNDDLVKEYRFVEDYTFEWVTAPEEEGANIVIQGIPKPGRPIVWGSVRVTLRKNDLMPVSYLYYDQSGVPVREMTFSRYKTFSGRLLPSVTELKPLNKDGQKTTLIYEELSLDVDVPESLFSLRELRRAL